MAGGAARLLTGRTLKAVFCIFCCLSFCNNMWRAQCSGGTKATAAANCSQAWCTCKNTLVATKLHHEAASWAGQLSDRQHQLTLSAQALSQLPHNNTKGVVVGCRNPHPTTTTPNK